jgi:hypothetical protein
MKINDVIAEISKGTFDNQLRTLNDVIKSRKERVAEQTLYSLQPGDLVRVDNIRPKAICGKTAKVVHTNRTTVTVKFGEDAGRHRGVCRVPSACCEKVEA